MIGLLLQATLALASEPTISIYDSPSDKSKVVVQACGISTCAFLLTDKATLTADFDRINAWVRSVQYTLD